MFPLITISDEIKIPTYTLIISLTVFLIIYLAIFKARTRNLSIALTLDMCFSIVFGGFLGARLFHVFYEGLAHYTTHPWDILKVWQGGFVYYGGVIGAVLLSGLVAQRRKVSFLNWADFFAPIASLGYALGRIGCFFQGCCHGKICLLPWAVKFPTLSYLVHPTQLYATFMELLIFGLLILLEKKRPPLIKPSGSLFFIWIFFHSIARLIMEHFRGDFRGEPLWGLSISSLISWFLLILSFTGFFWLRYRASKSPQ